MMARQGKKTPNEWFELPLNGCSEESPGVRVSNPAFPLPRGLTFQQNFLSQDEEDDLLREIVRGEFVWEGFDQRRRVQRFSFDRDEPISPLFVTLRDRIEQATGHRALNLAIEEHDVEAWSRSGDYASNSKVTTFESVSLCSCEDGPCRCFVAQIPLQKAALQHFNKPLKRLASFWELESPDHWTDLYMNARSLLVKTDDCLWSWRAQMTASSESSTNTYVLKFFSMRVDSISKQYSSLDDENDSFGYIPSENDRIPLPDDIMPPMEDLLTIIITTSPIKSIPSTEVVERAMETFLFGGEAFAFKCRKLIVCDGVRTQEGEGSTPMKNYANIKQAMRNGIVTGNQAGKYRQYKDNLRALCESSAKDSPFNNAVVEELDERQGYGFALRHALTHCVKTPFVCVVQHDRTFMRPTPIHETLHAMWRNPGIKYVGMTMRSNLTYRDTFVTKYGKMYKDEFRDMILRPPELQVESSLFGPDSESTAGMAYSSEKLRRNILSVAETYRPSRQARWEQEWIEQHGKPGKQQLSLTPTLFWYDNVHICETAHYRDFVFHPSYKMVARGGFVEDKLSPVIKRTVERLGLREGHRRFGCYLLDDHSGMFFTGHLDGGGYMTTAERKTLLAKRE